MRLVKATTDTGKSAVLIRKSGRRPGLQMIPDEPVPMPHIIGRYEFAPALGANGKRVRRDGATTDWWLIIRLDKDLGRYLRQLYTLDSPAGGAISDPLWGAHVSIVQNEKPENLQHWQDRDGREVELEYLQDPRETDGYLFLPVVCAEALDYRQTLGLPREPRWPLHLTFGNRKNG